MTFNTTKTAILAAALTVPAVFAPAALAGNTGYQPYNGHSPHEACKRDEQNSKVTAGIVGAIAGGVLGSQIAGDGARTEGSALGAVVGGLAGAGIADKRVDCDPAYNSYNQRTYGNDGYRSQPVYQNQGYNNQGYQNQGYQQPRYQDRVTYSNHPVYQNPTYGSGGIYNGTTYRTGTTTYGQTYGQPTYQRTRSVPVRRAKRKARRAYNRGYNQGYNAGAVSHYHGKYICNGYH